MLIPGLFFIPESPRWLVVELFKINFLFKNFVAIVSWLICLVGIQAKMGMTEDFESSLQVLRGFDTDISIEVNEIKVLN